MAEADWDSYVAIAAPFHRSEAHNLLLVPGEAGPAAP